MTTGAAGRVRIGTSGWQYRHWRGDFYPAGLPVSGWLRSYAERFDTVELNNPFYRQPERATFARWRAAVPEDFSYAVKLNRFITHIKRLNVEAESVRRAYDTLTGLGPKAAVVLAQLPPGMRFDPERTRAYFSGVARRRRRHAIEPRDASWFTDDALAMLRSLRVGLCIADTPRFPTALAVTADFVYVRFHGPGRLYASNYDEAALREWARRFQDWRDQGLDVFGYFNNDGFGYAPRNAMRLRELVG
ncbi:MAG: DUF72 domain-containing protein [Candidatus Limnocylindria bacterium]